MGMRLFAEPHFLDQRPGFGFVAAEAHVEFHRMLGTALRKDILTERAGDLAVEDALFLDIYFDELIRFAEQRYRYLNTIAEEIERQVNQYLDSWKNKKIER